MMAKPDIAMIVGLCIGLILPGVAMSDTCPQLQLLREERREDVQAARDNFNSERDKLDKAFREKKKELHENGWLTRQEIDRAYAERKKNVDNSDERNRLTDAEMKKNVLGHGYETALCAGYAAILTTVAASVSRAFCSALM